MEPLAIIAFLAAVLGAAWRLATPFIYTSLGEVFSERAGVLNIGLEGVMLIGAFNAFAIAFFTGSPFLGLAAALAAGLLCGLLFAFLTVTVRANQIVVGAAFNLAGLGLTSFLYRSVFSGRMETAREYVSFVPIEIPFLSRLPFFGEIFFRQNLIVYATPLVVLAGAFILYRTAFGLSLRAVGEHPRTVDAAGLKVSLIRYCGVLTGCGLAAMGGAYLTIAHTNQFNEGITSGRGFIALAVVVIGRWSPWGAFFVSLLFGFFYALQLRLQAVSSITIPYQFLQALPYLLTLLVFVVLRKRTAPPAALGVPYKS